MTNITTIGLDLAKSVFQVHGADRDGFRQNANVDTSTSSNPSWRSIYSWFA